MRQIIYKIQIQTKKLKKTESSENEDEDNNVNNDSNSNNENLFDKLSDDKDFTYNLSKFINSIDLDIIKNQDNIK